METWKCVSTWTENMVWSETGEGGMKRVRVGGRKGREGERRDGACIKDRRTREGSAKNEGWRQAGREWLLL